MQTHDCDENRRVLIVDDNEAIHEDFRKILAGQEANTALADAAGALFGAAPRTPVPVRYELFSAYQGQEATEMVTETLQKGEPFAMAFVDMRMPPGWDGVETIEHLWRADPDLQVVICTAYSDYSWSQITDRLGREDRLLILKKPFDDSEISQMACALTDKWNLARRARLKMEEMDRMVAERTAELKAANERLAKEMKERLRAAEELREKDLLLRQKHKLEAIGSLAGGVAHEFNNLLQVIRGYTVFAMGELSNKDRPLKDLEQVIEAVDRATTITRQLLNFSRQGPTRKTRQDVNEIVCGAVELLRPVLGEAIEIELLLGEDAGWIVADSAIMAQALMNLCVNARDAMPAGGKLIVETTRGRLPDQRGGSPQSRPDLPPGEYAVLRVTDTGCGMTAEVQQRIFDPFYTTKEVGKGTGMGLSMVYGAVDQHDGTIRLKSEVGTGTTFTIHLPLTEPAVRSATQESDPQDPCTGDNSETILIAEDEPLVRAVADRVLRQAGYNVITAVDGEDAIRQFDLHGSSISLAILDVAMPKVSGHKVHQYLKQHKAGVGVVFCTGYVPDTAQDDFAREEDLRVLSKPFEPDVLLRTVREVLDELQQFVNSDARQQSSENALSP